MKSTVRFTDTDSVEITIEPHSLSAFVLTCYRSNLGPGHGWHPVWLEDVHLPDRKLPVSFLDLSSSFVEQIAEEEKRNRGKERTEK